MIMKLRSDCAQLLQAKSFSADHMMRCSHWGEFGKL
jgi:hypothetical protein